MKKTLRSTMASTALAVASLALVAQPALAAPITQWSYDLYTHFADPAANVFSSGTGSQVEQLGQVSWGDPADNVFTTGAERSGITIASIAGANQSADPAHVFGTYTTDNLLTPATGAWITHHNNPISGSFATLLSSVIDSKLILTSVTPSGVAVTDTIPFTVLFAETENSGTCAATSPANNPCNDIFALNGDNFDKHLIIGGYDYYVSIFPTAGPGIISGSLPFLGNSVCGAVVGASPNCVGFTTIEGQDTSIQFGFTITSTPLQVPEPGILALFGIGLMGLFVARRRLS